MFLSVLFWNLIFCLSVKSQEILLTWNLHNKTQIQHLFLLSKKESTLQALEFQQIHHPTLMHLFSIMQHPSLSMQWHSFRFDFLLLRGNFSTKFSTLKQFVCRVEIEKYCVWKASVQIVYVLLLFGEKLYCLRCS